MLCHLFSYICHIYVVDDGIRAHCLSNVWIAFLPQAIKTWWWNIDFYNCVHHGDDEQKKVVCCCQAGVPHWLKISILESQLKECYDDWQGGYKECTLCYDSLAFHCFPPMRIYLFSRWIGNHYCSSHCSHITLWLNCHAFFLCHERVLIIILNYTLNLPGLL